MSRLLGPLESALGLIGTISVFAVATVGGGKRNGCTLQVACRSGSPIRLFLREPWSRIGSDGFEMWYQEDRTLPFCIMASISAISRTIGYMLRTVTIGIKIVGPSPLRQPDPNAQPRGMTSASSRRPSYNIQSAVEIMSWLSREHSTSVARQCSLTHVGP